MGGQSLQWINPTETTFYKRTFDLQHMWLSSASDKPPCYAHVAISSPIVQSGNCFPPTGGMTYQEWVFLVMRHQSCFFNDEPMILPNDWSLLLSKKRSCPEGEEMWKKNRKMELVLLILNEAGRPSGSSANARPPCETELLNGAINQMATSWYTF